MADVLGLTVNALLTLAMFTIAFQMNPAYRVAEVIFLGALAGQILVVTVNSLVSIDFASALSGDIVSIISILVGLLVFTKLSKPYKWVSRYPTSLMVGTTTGLVLGKIMDTQGLALIRPLMTTMNFENLLSVLIILVVSIYFIFIDVQNEGLKNALGFVRSIARPLIFAFYVSWGYSLMVFGRTTATVERLIFILFEWIPSLTGG